MGDNFVLEIDQEAPEDTRKETEWSQIVTVQETFSSNIFVYVPINKTGTN